MSALVRLVTLTLALGGAIVVEVACTSTKPDACTVDTDCPQGSFCRAGFCAIVASDSGGPDADLGACGTLQNPCATDDSGVGSSSGSTCKDVYALCSGDFECCEGLTCLSGACR